MLRRVALVRTDVSEERSASIMRMHSHIVFLRIVCRLLVTANVLPSSLILVTYIPPKRRFLTRATWRDVTEDGILHSHRCENFKSDI
jgi:hypothetical protein